LTICLICDTISTEDNIVLSHKNKEEQTVENNHGTNRKSPKFFTKLGILVGFIVEVVTAIFMDMTEDQLQHQIYKKETTRKKIRAIFKDTEPFIEEKERWRKFYQKYFSLELNFTDIAIPERPSIDTWSLVIIAQGLTLNQVYKSMSSAFKCWKYADDLDASVTKNTRDTKSAYAIWVHDRVEPDVQYLGHSTKQIDPDMTIGVTLLERMIMEIAYFDFQGKHLDIKGITFCSGSRNSDGFVPCVSFFDSKVDVGWYDLDESFSDCGVREAVSI
jgi:hypothetical protein